MGTQTRSELFRTGAIMKPIPPTDREEMSGHNYEMVPKIPSVKITKKGKGGPHLSDFLDNSKSEDHNRGAFQLKPVGRDKAFAILKQYNKLVSSDATLTVKNLPPLKLPLGNKYHQPTTLPKPEVTPRKVPIFTEGISSISKFSKPSFVIPKDKVIRANLPNNIIVAQKKDAYAFGVKPSKKKLAFKESEEGSKFKQMHNLGLDSLPIINLEKYMRAKSNPKNGVKCLKPSVNVNKKVVRPRRLEPLNSDYNLNNSVEMTRSYDWSMEKRKPNRWHDQTSAKSEGKAKVVWIGKNVRSDYAINRAKLLKGIHQQQNEGRQKLPDDLHQNNDHIRDRRDPSVYGVCSLAPIDIIGQSKLIVGDIRNPGSYRIFQNNHTRSNINDYFYDSESESSLNTDWKNMINNAVTHRSSSVGSGTATPRGVPNPPPSYVSSSVHEEDEILVPLEISKTMHRIQEERSSLMMDSASNRNQQLFSAASCDINTGLSPPPVITVNNVAVEEDGEEQPNSFPVEQERSEYMVQPNNTPRKSKEPLVKSVIELKMDDKHLNVPKLMDSERRPPVKSEATLDSNSQPQSHSSIHASKSKLITGAHDGQKINITTLEFVTSNDRKSPSMPLNTVVTDTETSGLVPRNNDKEHNNINETFKPITVNNKTLQFISPLHTQTNAKRQ